MTKKNKTEVLTKVVSLRISAHDFHQIVAESEERSMTIPDVLRGAWREHREQKNIDTALSKMEQKLTKRMFEIVSAIAGLDENERLLALKKYKARLAVKGGSK